MTITELIAKLEAASEGSEELDIAMSELLVPNSQVFVRVRHYTRSLDAALSAVPKGWENYVSAELCLGEWPQRTGRTSACWWELLDGHISKPTTRHVSGGHKDPILALCIAILRAKEQSE